MIPIYTTENALDCATTTIRDNLLKDSSYKVAGLSVKVDNVVYFLNEDLSSWKYAGEPPTSEGPGIAL